MRGTHNRLEKRQEAGRRPDIIPLEDFLPYRLSVTSNRISAELGKAYASRHGLMVPDWRMMAVIARFPGLSAREATQRTGMDKVTISRALARLIGRGLVKRQVSPDDRRRSELNLSPEGWETYGDIAPLVVTFERQLIAALSAEERRQISAILEKLTRVLDRKKD